MTNAACQGARPLSGGAGTVGGAFRRRRVRPKHVGGMDMELAFDLEQLDLDLLLLARAFVVPGSDAQLRLPASHCHLCLDCVADRPRTRRSLAPQLLQLFLILWGIEGVCHGHRHVHRHNFGFAGAAPSTGNRQRVGKGAVIGYAAVGYVTAQMAVRGLGVPARTRPRAFAGVAQFLKSHHGILLCKTYLKLWLEKYGRW